MNGHKKSMAGFTLMEAMIVAVIIGILFALAFPAYQQYTRKARRADCQAVMMSYANALERRYGATGSYLGDAMTNFSCPSNGSDNRTYLLALDPAATRTTFTITATPQKDQAKDSCGTLTLDQSGVKGVSGSTVANCW